MHLDLPPRSTDPVADKASWRRALRRARADLVTRQGPQGRARQGELLSRALLAWLQERGTAVAGLQVLAYDPLSTEPPVQALVTRLRRAGAVVRTPVPLPHGGLAWLATPAATGSHPLRPVDADRARAVPTADLPTPDLILVPALAVGRDGTRLGQGGGYYDRLLATLPGPSLAVVHDHEVLEQVPAQPHDAVVDAVLTTTGVRRC